MIPQREVSTLTPTPVRCSRGVPKRTENPTSIPRVVEGIGCLFGAHIFAPQGCQRTLFTSSCASKLLKPTHPWLRIGQQDDLWRDHLNDGIVIHSSAKPWLPKQSQTEKLPSQMPAAPGYSSLPHPQKGLVFNPDHLGIQLNTQPYKTLTATQPKGWGTEA